MAIIDKPSDYFNTKLYTGNGSTQSISDLNFSPDLVWIKQRNGTRYHRLIDSVRGATKELYSNSTDSEITVADGLTSFDSNGFTLGSGVASNGSGDTFVGWSWRGLDSSAVSNTQGSITSTVSANTTSGFSIVSYTGTGANATVGHGLNVAPSFLITKNRSGTDGWIVHTKAITATTWWDTRLLLASTATAGSGAGYLTAEPTSTLFAISSFSTINASGNNYITYCFAEKKGFSKFGSYTGNGSSDGTFVYTGFKPAFIIVKRTDSTGSWLLMDNKRDTFNVCDAELLANDSFQETLATNLDILSNGFKLRTTGGEKNSSGGSYIYMAFAENPFVTSTSIPCTAR